MTNEEMIATASDFNKNGETSNNEGENAARAAAAELAQATGSKNHEGTTEVRADSEEETAAIEAKKAEEAAEAEKKAAEEAEANKTDEQKAEEAAAAEALRKQVAEETDAAGWMETEDPTLQASMNLMKAAGLKPSEAGEFFNEALETGDINTVDVEALTARVGKDNAELIMSGVVKYGADQSAEVLSKVNAIQNEVGGKDNWAKMVKWSKAAARADDAVKSELTELQGMMNGSEMQGKLAAQRMMQMYNADSKNSTMKTAKVAPTLAPTSSAPASAPVKGISAQVYAESIQNLQSRGAARAAEMAALSKARAAGRKLGY